MAINKADPKAESMPIRMPLLVELMPWRTSNMSASWDRSKVPPEVTILKCAGSDERDTEAEVEWIWDVGRNEVMD